MAINQMLPSELAKKIIGNERLFILDVRNTEDFNDWKIEGKSIEQINEPYFNLLDGVESVTNRMPKDEAVLVVCAKGGSSEFVAEELQEAGLDKVYSLHGGMKAWSEYLEPVKVADLNNGGELYQFVRLGKGCLSYMVISDKEAIVIDASRMIEVYESFAADKGATIKYTVDTHLHADHISGGRLLAEKTGGAYYLPPKDARTVTFNYQPLVQGTVIKAGSTAIEAEAVYSPGHTIGSTSLIVDDAYLLTGDILFVESIGRPDLAGQAEDWAGDLRETLYDRYLDLSAGLVVLPAHFATISELTSRGTVEATLGELYEKNVGLQVEDEAAFRRMVSENLPPQPNAYQEIRQLNMGQLTADKEEQREMEIGPNRCAVN